MGSRQRERSVRIYKAKPTPQGEERWGVDWIDPETGRRHRRIIGTKEEAEREAARLEAKGREKTLEDAGRAYMLRLAGKRSLRNQRERWNRIMADLGADTPLSSLRTDVVLTWRADLLTRGYKANTINTFLDSLVAGMHVAVEEEWIPKLPFKSRGLRLDAPSAGRAPPEEEVERAMRAASPKMRLALLLASECGLRSTEVSSLRVDMLSGETLRLGRTKTDRGRSSGRVVPLTDRASAALRSWVRHLDEGETWVFGEGWSASGAFRSLKRRLRAKGEPELRFRFHDLRHLATTRMRRAGVDVYTLRRIMGWSSHRMLDVYSHITDEDWAEVRRKLSAYAKVPRGEEVPDDQPPPSDPDAKGNGNDH